MSDHEYDPDFGADNPHEEPLLPVQVDLVRQRWMQLHPDQPVEYDWANRRWVGLDADPNWIDQDLGTEDEPFWLYFFLLLLAFAGLVLFNCFSLAYVYYILGIIWQYLY